MSPSWHFHYIPSLPCPWCQRESALGIQSVYKSKHISPRPQWRELNDFYTAPSCGYEHSLWSQLSCIWTSALLSRAGLPWARYVTSLNFHFPPVQWGREQCSPRAEESSNIGYVNGTRPRCVCVILWVGWCLPLFPCSSFAHTEATAITSILPAEFVFPPTLHIAQTF